MRPTCLRSDLNKCSIATLFDHSIAQFSSLTIFDLVIVGGDDVCRLVFNEPLNHLAARR